jgi:hypothetical protein
MVSKSFFSGYGYWVIYNSLVVWRWYASMVLQCCCSGFMMICLNGLLWWFGHMFVNGLEVTCCGAHLFPAH